MYADKASMSIYIPTSMCMYMDKHVSIIYCWYIYIHICIYVYIDARYILHVTYCTLHHTCSHAHTQWYVFSTVTDAYRDDFTYT